MNRQQLYEKILSLEKQLPVKPVYSFLEPFDFNSRSDQGLQFAVNQITKHIGFNEKLFSVGFSSLNPGQAGKIHLNYWEETNRIEVDRAYAGEKNVILGVLAHEVTHKILHKFEMEENSEAENEKLTDLCSIYLGLGKLIINGKEIKYANQNRVEFGYLSKGQIAFTFNLFAEMRKIKKPNCYKNLLASAEHEVKTSYEKNKGYFSEKFRDDNYILHIIISLRDYIALLQNLAITAEILIDNLKVEKKTKDYDIYVDAKLNAYELHKIFLKTQNDLRRFYDYHELDTSIKYFQSVKLKKYVEKTTNIIVDNVKTLVLELKKLFDSKSEISQQIAEIVFSNKCPLCRTHDIQIIEKSTPDLYSCKNCSYVFRFENNRFVSPAILENEIVETIKSIDPKFHTGRRDKKMWPFAGKKSKTGVISQKSVATKEVKTSFKKESILTRIARLFRKNI